MRAQAPRWATPTLLLYAGADRCVDPEGSAAFAARSPRRWVHAQCFDGCFHELFHEPPAARMQALQAVQRALQALGEPPAGVLRQA